MPGKSTHKAVGGAAGLIYSFRQAEGQEDSNRAIESIGGTVGGVLGGMLPDIVEPADTPDHRGFAHSVLVGLGVASVKLDEWSAACRAKAEQFAVLRQSETDPIKWLLLWLLEVVCRLVAGFLLGIQAGYGSHLVLDALTPKSLPLVT